MKTIIKYQEEFQKNQIIDLIDEDLVNNWELFLSTSEDFENGLFLQLHTEKPLNTNANHYP